MKIRCMAVDDEPLALKQLAGYISKVPFLELAAQCQSAVEAREYLEHDTVDAIFCDINMPDLGGMEFVKSLALPPLIVFTTAYAEYAVEGFRVNAVDYLLKPFGLQDFQRAALRLKERMEGTSLAEKNPTLQTDSLFLKTLLNSLYTPFMIQGIRCYDLLNPCCLKDLSDIRLYRVPV